jgi:hypothetical protein
VRATRVRYRRGKNGDSEEDTGTPTSCEILNLVDSSTPSDTRRSALGRIETCAELGVEGGGSSEVAEWEGVGCRPGSLGSGRVMDMGVDLS